MWSFHRQIAVLGSDSASFIHPRFLGVIECGDLDGWPDERRLDLSKTAISPVQSFSQPGGSTSSIRSRPLPVVFSESWEEAIQMFEHRSVWRGWWFAEAGQASGTSKQHKRGARQGLTPLGFEGEIPQRAETDEEAACSRDTCLHNDPVASFEGRTRLNEDSSECAGARSAGLGCLSVHMLPRLKGNADIVHILQQQ